MRTTNNNNNNVLFSVPFLLRSTRPITWNKISGEEKKIEYWNKHNIKTRLLVLSNWSNIHFLWRIKQIDHLPKCIFKVHLLEFQQSPEVLLPLGIGCEVTIILLAVSISFVQEWRGCGWERWWHWRWNFPKALHSLRLLWWKLSEKEREKKCDHKHFSEPYFHCHTWC